ncbi:hypothetical protein IWW50_005653 [Coemansia erecta]|nr:hypothetical protein GGF43_005180 [Coemansia sp. RSA 2618]KAJ2818898.1 hypothetical protein IWW50_005653 [Coemansia erecta]
MYPPNDGYSGYPPSDFDTARSMGCPPNKRNSINNSAVGEGPMSDSMPMGPGGFGGAGFGGPGFSGPGFGGPRPGGPGGFTEPGGFMMPPPNNGGYGGYPPNNGGYGGNGGYPPNNGGYPSGNGGYPPSSGGGGYPPSNGCRPRPTNNGYPPQAPYGGFGGGNGPPQGSGGGYPPMNNGYPPQSPYGDSGPRPPPRNDQRPPASAGPNMTGPNSNASLRPPPGPNQQLHQSAPNLGGNPNRPPQTSQPPQQQQPSGPQASQYKGPGSASAGNLPPNNSSNNANRGMYWSPVNSQNTRIPGTAVRAGTYGDDPVFVGRASHKDSMQVGMITMSKEGLVVSYDGKPVLFREYEVLCGPPSKVKWIPVRGRFDPKDIKGARPLACGHEKSGDVLYAATTSVHGRDYVGKVSVKAKAMLYPHKGSEDKAKSYSVLCEL